MHPVDISERPDCGSSLPSRPSGWVGEDGAGDAVLPFEWKRLVRLCASLSGDANAAEDLAQETLIEAWRNTYKLYDPQGYSQWLTAIARNVCRRYQRRHARERSRLVVLDDETSDESAPLSLADERDLELELEHDELATLLDRALALLPAEARALLVQKYVEESPHAEIAARLGLSENAVAVRLHRGKLAFRRILETTLREDAAAFGLAEPETDGWQATRIWCSNCGQNRLMGRFDASEFVLRCLVCCVEPDAYHSQSNGTPTLAGVKGFRPALNRFNVWLNDFFQPAIAQRAVSCQRCRRATPLRMGLPGHVPPSLRDRPGVHVRCDHCGASAYEELGGVALNLPEGRRFWREHPRIRALPHRPIDLGGRPSLLICYEDVAGAARFEAVVARDTYELLEVHGGVDA